MLANGKPELLVPASSLDVLKVASINAVEEPMTAVIHIQNTAPGPPMAIAPATPAIFPVPTVPANAVQTA